MESKTDISVRRPSRHRTRSSDIPLESSRQRASATCIHKSINRITCLLLSEEKKYTALPLGGGADTVYHLNYCAMWAATSYHGCTFALAFF